MVFSYFTRNLRPVEILIVKIEPLIKTGNRFRWRLRTFNKLRTKIFWIERISGETGRIFTRRKFFKLNRFAVGLYFGLVNIKS